MFSNGVTADGTGWTFKGFTTSTTDQLVITTQCAALPGSYVAQAHIPVTNTGGNLYGPCAAGYTLLSGGVYLSKSDGTEHNGTIFYSWPGSNSWFVSGASDGFPDTKLIALAQCTL